MKRQYGVGLPFWGGKIFKMLFTSEKQFNYIAKNLSGSYKKYIFRFFPKFPQNFCKIFPKITPKFLEAFKNFLSRMTSFFRYPKKGIFVNIEASQQFLGLNNMLPRSPNFSCPPRDSNKL